MYIHKRNTPPEKYDTRTRMAGQGKKHTQMVSEGRYLDWEKKKSQHTMSSQVPIDVDPEAPSGLERLVAAALLQITDVPEDVSSWLPAETVPVSVLLKSNVPGRLSDTSIIKTARLCFSPLDPRWTVDELFATLLPPRAWLNVLENDLSDMWGSGMSSIVPPLSSNPNLRLPLWIVTFWNMAVEVAEQRDKWRAAEEWLLGRTQDSSIREARKLLEKIPWGLKLWSLVSHDKETRVGHLAGLLSDEWLSERHIDTISSYLNFRAQKGPESRPTSLVAGLDLQIYLSASARATAEMIRGHEGLRAYARQISDHCYSRVFIPANVGGNHWLVFSVDFEENKIEYGESLVRTMNSHLLDGHNKGIRSMMAGIPEI